MANPEHLKILEQGAKIWNKWRKKNPNIKPDLSAADIFRVNLNKINFSEVNLKDAVLEGSDLVDAVLRKALLYDADLIGTNLTRSDLRNANLCKAIFLGANLQEANLSDTYSAGANFYSANLQRANLEYADLTYSSLVRANLTGAILTGVALFGVSRDDWKIKDVECKYIYWDEYGEQRSPKDKDLKAGEFEKLYAALPTIEYIFENGMSPMDPLIMDRVVQAIREKKPEFDIKIDSINARGLAPSIKFNVRYEKQKGLALKEVKKIYELKIKQLESERDRYCQLLARAIDAPRDVKLITAGPGAIVATDGSTINIQQHIHNAIKLQEAIAKEPEDSESFARVTKRKALDIIGGVVGDIAKGQVVEAAKQIVELGKDLGPIIVKTAAYAFFKSMLQ